MSKVNIIAGLVLASWLSACGGSNVNQIFTNPEEKNSADYLLSQAEYQYDKGNFDKAKSFAQKAWDNNNQSERAAMILGYTHLALAGVDIFRLAKILIKETDTNGTNSGTGTNNNNVDILGSLTEVTTLTDDEFRAMTTNGEPEATDVSIFEPYPIYLPKLASEARALSAPFADNIREAIKYLCPFIGDQAKSSDDSRHNCTASTNDHIDNPGRLNFAWAFVHLMEAIAFQSVALYKNDSASQPNMLSRATALSNLKNSDPTTYVAAAQELVSDIDAILPVDDRLKDAMLTAIITDFEVTTNAIAQIAGVPEKFSLNISKSYDKLKGWRDKINNVKQVTTTK